MVKMNEKKRRPLFNGSGLLPNLWFHIRAAGPQSHKLLFIWQKTAVDIGEIRQLGRIKPAFVD